MNILMIGNTDPRLKTNGGQQRTYALWQGLKTIGDVWTIVPVAHKSEEMRDDAERIYKVCLEKRYSPGWFLQRLWARFMPHIVVPWGARLPGKNGRCGIEAIKNVKFDITVVRFGLAARLRPWRIAPMFMDVDDVPVDDYVRAHPSHRFRLWLLKRWQDRLCRRTRQFWVPDPEEVKMLVPYPAAHVPNIPMVDGIKPPKVGCSGEYDAKRNVLLFIGYLAHVPNQVALDWFLRTHWENLKRKFPSLRYRIAGGGLPDHYKKEWSRYKDVELLGFVDDLNSVYASGCAILTPMRIGSGTCLKVLEALAYGMPIVSTSQGLRGIPKEDRTESNGIYEFETGADLEAVIGKLQAGAACGESAAASRAYIDRHYSQTAFNEKLRRAIEAVGTFGDRKDE